MPHSYWIAGYQDNRILCYCISCNNVPAVLWVGLGTAVFTFTNALAHNERLIDCSASDRDFQTHQEPGEVTLFLRLEVLFVCILPSVLFVGLTRLQLSEAQCCHCILLTWPSV
jgi:hypothetical protein